MNSSFRCNGTNGFFVLNNLLHPLYERFHRIYYNDFISTEKRMFLLNTSTKRAVSRKEYTMKSRYEIVLKVAEMGNITRAAKALNYTQSGVSHAVAAIEKETGCTLFRAVIPV